MKTFERLRMSRATLRACAAPLLALLLFGCGQERASEQQNHGPSRQLPAATQGQVQQRAPVRSQPAVTTDYAPVYSLVQRPDGSTAFVETGRMPVYVLGNQGEFGGYECTEDCSGHEAGYLWAEENGIEDPDDCGGNSSSFIEGCMSYAEEQLQENDMEEE